MKNGSRPKSGQGLRALGMVLFWAGVIGGILVVGFARTLGREGLFLVVPILSLLCIALSWLGLKTLHRGRQYDAPAGDRSLQSDHRAPIVYLRSFDQDADSARPMNAVGGYRYRTEEEQLAAVLGEIGPCVAIGEPGEALPDLGADRIYISDDWQTRVLELIDRARLVVLRAASSEGIWWEFRQVVERLDPHRVLLIIPSDQPIYEAFTRRAEEILPLPLPGYPSRKHRIGSIRGFVIFGTGWAPELLPAQRTFLRTRFKAPLSSTIKLTLEPVFEQLAVAWQRPSIAKVKLMVLVSFGAVGLLSTFVWAILSFPEFDHFLSSTLSPSKYSDEPAQDRGRSAETSAGALPVVVGQNPYDAALVRLKTAIESSPAILAALEGIPPDQVRARAAELSALGLRRLDKVVLVDRARLMARILEVAETAECAVLLSVTSPIHDVLPRLEAAEINGWFELALSAMLAEARKDPAVVPFDEVRFIESFQRLVIELPKERKETFIQVFVDPTSMPDEEVCWAARTLYRGLLRLEEPHRSVLARGLVEP